MLIISVLLNASAPGPSGKLYSQIITFQGKFGTNALHSTKPVILIIFVWFFSSKQQLSCQRSVTTHQRVLECAAEKIPGWWNMPSGSGRAK